MYSYISKQLGTLLTLDQYNGNFSLLIIQGDLLITDIKLYILCVIVIYRSCIL